MLEAVQRAQPCCVSGSRCLSSVGLGPARGELAGPAVCGGVAHRSSHGPQGSAPPPGLVGGETPEAGTTPASSASAAAHPPA